VGFEGGYADYCFEAMARGVSVALQAENMGRGAAAESCRQSILEMDARAVLGKLGYRSPSRLNPPASLCSPMLGLIRYGRNRFYDGKTVCIPTRFDFLGCRRCAFIASRIRGGF